MMTPALYCRNTGSIVHSAEGSCVLCGPGSFDFTTYFNAFSNKKWRKYSIVENVHLHFEVKGSSGTCHLTCLDAFMSKPETIEGFVVSFQESDSWQSFDVSLPNSDDELIGFRIDANGHLSMRNAYYYTEIESSKIKPCELALATTTFKKEDFIIPNVQLVRNAILSSDEPVADHFTMHVVDNGRTLDEGDIVSDHIYLHPNDNVGGSGGFARGMIEAMRQDPAATNVVLMDDDVAVSPESIIRTYNLITLLRDEYERAFIGGAMLNYDIPDEQWEDNGCLDKWGMCTPVKPRLRMTNIRDIVINEDFDSVESVVASGKKPYVYQAWWYCCIPTATIREKGLPLPLFVRFDDVEYGLRCAPEFITLNGICIWHVAFNARYNAAVERYQTIRNGLVLQSTTGQAQDCDYLAQLKDAIQVELKKFSYENAELLLEGFEDYMKGPSFIMEPGMVEKRFMDANRKKETLKSFKELEKQVGKLTITRVDVYSDKPRTIGERLVDFMSFNGQRILYTYKSDSNIAVIPIDGGAYPAGKIRGVEEIVAIDTFCQQGVLRKKDVTRFKEIWNRYKKDLRMYGRRKNELRASYSAAAKEMTSIGFWEKYLGIDK